MAKKTIIPKRRGGNKKRTTVRSVYTAIQKYPRSQGASVREIYRAVSKTDPERSKRSVSSVKMAIARAVSMGNIRAPKGWPGFRGIPMQSKTGQGRGRNAKRLAQHKKKNLNSSAQRSPSIRRVDGKGPDKTPSMIQRTRSLSSPRGSSAKGPGLRGYGTRSLSRGPMKARATSTKRGSNRGGRGRSTARGHKRQGRKHSQWPKSKTRRTSNRNNCSPANASTNYSEGETPEEPPSTSICPANICNVS